MQCLHLPAINVDDELMFFRRRANVLLLFSVLIVFAYLFYIPCPGHKKRPLILQLDLSNDGATYDLAIPFGQFGEIVRLYNLSSRQTNILQQILDEFCRIHQVPLVDRPQHSFPAGCCSNGGIVDESLNDCVRKLSSSFGGMPSMGKVLDFVNSPHGQQVPVYSGLSFYHRPSVRTKRKSLACSIRHEKRNITYEFLRRWINFSHQHKIMWWLTYGSLLGAVRDGDFIPYDKDTDLSVFNTAEGIFKNFTPLDPAHFNWQKITLVRRSVDYCARDNGARMTCNGLVIRHQLDVCAFCEPMARMVLGFSFLDVFGVRLAFLFKDDDSGNSSSELGLFEEGLTWMDKLSYPLNAVFPLKTCRFLGLDLPCPRKPEVILESTYGASYRTPLWFCNPDTGQWESSYQHKK